MCSNAHHICSIILVPVTCHSNPTSPIVDMIYTKLENTHLTIVWMSPTHYIYAAPISLVLLHRNVSDKIGNKHVYIHDTYVHATDMIYE